MNKLTLTEDDVKHIFLSLVHSHEAFAHFIIRAEEVVGGSITCQHAELVRSLAVESFYHGAVKGWMCFKADSHSLDDESMMSAGPMMEELFKALMKNYGSLSANYDYERDSRDGIKKALNILVRQAYNETKPIIDQLLPLINVCLP